MFIKHDLYSAWSARDGGFREETGLYVCYFPHLPALFGIHHPYSYVDEAQDNLLIDALGSTVCLSTGIVLVADVHSH